MTPHHGVMCAQFSQPNFGSATGDMSAWLYVFPDAATLSGRVAMAVVPPGGSVKNAAHFYYLGGGWSGFSKVAARSV
jgi:hypothetical protein